MYLYKISSGLRGYSVIIKVMNMFAKEILFFLISSSPLFVDAIIGGKYVTNSHEYPCMVQAKIQQTKMLVTCQRFGDWFLFGLVWPYSSNQKNIMKVGSKSLLLTCSSNKL